MSAFNHRFTPITMDEAPSFKDGGYTVDSRGLMIYRASSVHGVAYALTPQTALDEARGQIDRRLAEIACDSCPNKKHRG